MRLESVIKSNVWKWHYFVVTWFFTDFILSAGKQKNNFEKKRVLNYCKTFPTFSTYSVRLL